MDAAAWRKNRTAEVKAPSGTVYKVRLLDPLTLIQEWISAGVEKPLDQKDLGAKVAQPEVVAAILLKFVVEPKITPKPSENSLGIEELMSDQTDAVALYRKIISPFVDHAKETAEFFRSIGIGIEDRTNSVKLPQSADRNLGVKDRRSDGKAGVERSGDIESTGISPSSK
jgi:hypothetical protein